MTIQSSDFPSSLIYKENTLILKNDFNKEQKKLTDELMRELDESYNELHEYSEFECWGMLESKDDNRLLVSIKITKPEDHKTLFGKY